MFTARCHGSRMLLACPSLPIQASTAFSTSCLMGASGAWKSAAVTQ